MASSYGSARLELLPAVVLQHIVTYLSAEDTVRLARTCRRLYSSLPSFVVMRGLDFHIYGPRKGHWCPELYFNGPILTRPVKRLTISLTWKDQGFGNRKGQIYVILMRKHKKIAESHSWIGLALHEEETKSAELSDHAVVTEARPGDRYTVMRNAGGGGGHRLIVNNFKLIAESQT